MTHIFGKMKNIHPCGAQILDPDPQPWGLQEGGDMELDADAAPLDVSERADRQERIQIQTQLMIWLREFGDGVVP